MFGYLTADRGHLTPEEDARYRAAYCGLCRSLRTRWGRLSGLTLNYDQCFLILLLQSLYEAEERSGKNLLDASVRNRIPGGRASIPIMPPT